MIEQKSLFRQDIKAYHLDSGLLYQFILCEFFATIQGIRNLQQEMKNFQNGKANIIETHLQILIGHQEDSLHGFNWRPEYAALTKLRIYCTQFAETAESDDKGTLGLQELADQAWLIASQTVTTFKIQYRNGEFAKVLLNLQKNIAKLDKIISKLSKQILKALARFKLNENVLFYLLRHNDQIVTAFGLSQSQQLFKKLFKDGLREAVQYMTSRYALRGFSQLVPIISSRAAELEKKV